MYSFRCNGQLCGCLSVYLNMSTSVLKYLSVLCSTIPNLNYIHFFFLVTCVKREIELQHYGVFILSSPHYPQPYASLTESCIWIFHAGYSEQNIFLLFIIELFLDEFDMLMVGNTSEVMTNIVHKFPQFTNTAPKTITLKTPSMWALFRSRFQRRSHKFYFVVNAYKTTEFSGNMSIYLV